MNPQPSQEFVSIFTILIIGIFIYYFVKAYNNGPHIKLPNDFITIGYLQSEPINVINKTYHVKETPVKITDEQFYNDCVEALYALGFKKAQAKKITKNIFESHSPSTVQEFLVLALNK